MITDPSSLKPGDIVSLGAGLQVSAGHVFLSYDPTPSTWMTFIKVETYDVAFLSGKNGVSKTRLYVFMASDGGIIQVLESNVYKLDLVASFAGDVCA